MSDKPHEFNEGVDDYSMCVCGVPADVHAEAMSAHVLTTATIRERFADAYGNYENGLEDFDRWLGAHDAEVARTAVEAFMAEGVTFDPTRTQSSGLRFNNVRPGWVEVAGGA